MKKFLFICVMAAIATCANAQVQIIQTSKIMVKSNQDGEAAKERVKAELDKNKELSSFQRAIAKKMAGSIVKKQFKAAEQDRYAFGFTDGEHMQYCQWDGVNNRSAIFCPSMGRITVLDWKNGKTIVAYPALKIAGQWDFSPEAAKQQGQSDPATMTMTKPIPEGAEVTEVNGFPCIPNVAFIEIQPGTTPERTMVVDGKKMEVIPASGHILVDDNGKDYFPSMYVDGENNTPVESIAAELIDFKKGTINEQNFTLPSDYKTYKDPKSLNKALLKLVKENKHVMQDPGKMVDVFWNL